MMTTLATSQTEKRKIWNLRNLIIIRKTVTSASTHRRMSQNLKTIMNIIMIVVHENEKFQIIVTGATTMAMVPTQLTVPASIRELSETTTTRVEDLDEADGVTATGIVTVMAAR